MSTSFLQKIGAAVRPLSPLWRVVIGVTSVLILTSAVIALLDYHSLPDEIALRFDGSGVQTFASPLALFGVILVGAVMVKINILIGIVLFERVRPLACIFLAGAALVAFAVFAAVLKIVSAN